MTISANSECGIVPGLLLAEILHSYLSKHRTSLEPRHGGQADLPATRTRAKVLEQAVQFRADDLAKQREAKVKEGRVPCVGLLNAACSNLVQAKTGTQRCRSCAAKLEGGTRPCASGSVSYQRLPAAVPERQRGAGVLKDLGKAQASAAVTVAEAEPFITSIRILNNQRLLYCLLGSVTSASALSFLQGLQQVPTRAQQGMRARRALLSSLKSRGIP